MEAEPEDELEAGELDEDLDAEDVPTLEHVSDGSSNKGKQAIARAERAAKATEAHAKKYELVRQGNYHGIFNKDSATTELFHTEGEAREYLNLLLHGYEGFYQGIPSGKEGQPINL